ncbi:Predicted PurR-regulated permease PerM [Lutimaribacter pacificus]|uniref:Predicted PurR-regulated permease PerM n=2 Tax=Lutimaribacter pacificus TaxID=391948 RepID=A0A1H0LSZ5_9RHOB|nr:Predicted PurR-regulated permease PerM [Lutimaribacter pacificus]SHK03670.1 Predicted PurR-regulated permease PerM [Lutimaribacter pacificus]
MNRPNTDMPAPKTQGTGTRRPDPYRLQTGALVIIAFAVVLFLLVQARFLLISLATAIVLFALTSDAINFIARQRVGPFRVPNWLASVVALALISAALLTLTSIILTQVNTVLFTTLTYTDRAPEALAAMFAWMGEDVEQAVFNSVRTVEVSGYLRSLAGQAGNLMQGTVLVILFVGFLFAERIWFSTKLTNFFGDPAQAERVGRIVGSIIHRVNYYLLVKTLVSAVTGLMIFGLAQIFGLELAVAMGVITFILNYIPNIGSIVATVLLALVAYVQFADPAMTLAIFLIAGAIQFVNGNVIDPMLMGRALRLSSFGIIISLAFWAAVWGIPGMFLSVPIMVGMMIVCSHVPALRPIAILLSREGLPEDEGDIPPAPESRERAARPSSAFAPDPDELPGEPD